MKKVLLTTVILMFSASLVFAQAGRIGIFGDATGAVTSCAVVDDAPKLLPLYVVHVDAPSVTASQFMAPQPACMDGTWLSDTAVFGVTLGNSQTGVAIAYGACLASPVHILTINIFASGTTAPCCVYPVTGDVNLPSGLIEIVDCADNLYYGDGQSGVINPDATCACVDIVATQESSWGKIKSLYNR